MCSQAKPVPVIFFGMGPDGAYKPGGYRSPVSAFASWGRGEGEMWGGMELGAGAGAARWSYGCVGAGRQGSGRGRAVACEVQAPAAWL